MRAHEFLIETTEEDRAIVSLALAISDYIDQFTDYENYSKDYGVIEISSIGEKFDTPLSILNPIRILVEPDRILQNQMNTKNADDETAGYWSPHNKTILLSKDLVGLPEMKSILSHELRHALDDLKSDFKAGTSKKYTTAKNKEADDPYLAEPAEINARFLEVMNEIVKTIRQAFKLSPEKIKPTIMQTFRQALKHYEIANLFPQKEKSRDYKRLIKRGMDLIQKEIQHQEILNNKKATGNY